MQALKEREEMYKPKLVINVNAEQEKQREKEKEKEREKEKEKERERERLREREREEAELEELRRRAAMVAEAQMEAEKALLREHDIDDNDSPDRSDPPPSPPLMADLKPGNYLFFNFSSCYSYCCFHKHSSFTYVILFIVCLKTSFLLLGM